MFEKSYIEKFKGTIVLLKLISVQNESAMSTFVTGILHEVVPIENSTGAILVLRPWKDSETLPQYIRERLMNDAVPVATHILSNQIVYIADLLDNKEIEIG